MTNEIIKKRNLSRERIVLYQIWFEEKLINIEELNFFIENLKEFLVHNKENNKNNLNLFQKFYKILELTYFILKIKKRGKKHKKKKITKFLKFKLAGMKKLEILTL